MLLLERALLVPKVRLAPENVALPLAEWPWSRSVHTTRRSPDRSTFRPWTLASRQWLGT